MKTFGLEHTTLNDYVEEVQQEPLIITNKVNPVALILGIDEEQLELGGDASFWELIEERRKEDRISQKELEQALESA